MKYYSTGLGENLKRCNYELLETGCVLCILFWLCLCTALRGDDYSADTLTVQGVTVYGGVSVNGGLWTSGVHVINDLSDDDYREGDLDLSSADDAVNFGDDVAFNTLSVTANASFGGNLLVDGMNLTIGSQAYSDIVTPNLIVNFQDNGDHDSSQVTFSVTYSYSWQWQQNGADNAENQMVLDSYPALHLYDPISNNSLHLNTDVFEIDSPSGGHITAPWADYGTFDNTTVLEFGYGGVDFSDNGLILGKVGINYGTFSYVITNSPYYSTNSINVDEYSNALGFSNGFILNGDVDQPLFGTGGGGFAIGQNATVSAYNALAFGNSTEASGYESLALSGGNAYGSYSLALGNESIATGVGSVALSGGNSTANGSIAIGTNATATSDYAMTVGPGTEAQAWGAVVVGHYNLTVGNSTVWQPSEPAFIVGTGNSTARADGLVITNDGNSTFSGNTTIVNPGYVSPTSSTQPQTLEINGASTFNGTTNFTGNVTFSHAQGDLPMGAFGR